MVNGISADQLKQQCALSGYMSIRNTMDNAEETGLHTPGSWTKEGMRHHLNHALEHIQDVIKSENSDPLVDIEHALCRMSMALWSYHKGILGEYGDEGTGT